MRPEIEPGDRVRVTPRPGKYSSRIDRRPIEGIVIDRGRWWDVDDPDEGCSKPWSIRIDGAWNRYCDLELLEKQAPAALELWRPAA